MVVLALIAFVAGTGLLQQCTELPPVWFCLMAGLAALAGTVSVTAGWGQTHAMQARRQAGGHAWCAIVVVLGAAALGAAHAALLAHVRLDDSLPFADEGRDVRIVGTIASLPADLPRATRFEFDVESVATPGVRVPRRIALAWYAPDTELHPAERWQFTVRLRRPHGVMNPGGFDLEGWMFERNLRASGHVRPLAANGVPLRLAPMVWSFGGAVDRARDRLRAALRERLEGKRHAGVLIALVLGDQRAIAEEDWRLFNRTGIAHLVSISGLHITMIAGLAAGAVSLAWRRSRRLLAVAPTQAAAAIGAMTAAFAYCLLAGWGVPAQRTFFMLAIVCAAALVRVRPRAGTTLSFAAAVVCALDPWAVGAPGFWLSFGAVAAILFAAQGRRQLPPHAWRGRLHESVRIQLAVTVALVPLTVVLFRQVSLVSPLANAVAIPVVSLLVTPLALGAAGLVALPEPLASFAVPPLAVAHVMFAVLADLLSAAGAWSWSSVALPAPALWALPVAVAGVAWMLAPWGWPLRWAGGVGLLPLFLLPGERPGDDALWVTAIDVGQGMAVLVEAGAHAMLFDAGPRYTASADAGARVIVPYLRWRGIGTLEWLVVSHQDADHSGGAASVLREIAVGRVLTSVPSAHAALQGAADSAAEIHRCEAGQRLHLGRAQVDVLHPAAGDYASGRRAANAMSCVLGVQLGTTRVLLTGDLPARQEAELVDRTANVQATLVSAPHHGSRHSSSPRFVEAVAARWVLVQAGYRNRFGHPHAEVQARWQLQGARVLRSDLAGAIQWRFDLAAPAAVEQWRAARSRYWHNRPPGGGPAHAADAGNAAGPAGPDQVETPTGIEVATPPADELEPF